jgi:hypothetical protein
MVLNTGVASGSCVQTADDIKTAALLEVQSLEAKDDADAKEGLLRTSQSLIRWGLLRDPNASLAATPSREHLGFGTTDMYVSSPVDGAAYS